MVHQTPPEGANVADTPGVYAYIAFLDRSVSFPVSVVGGDPDITECCRSIQMAYVNMTDEGSFVPLSDHCEAAFIKDFFQDEVGSGNQHPPVTVSCITPGAGLRLRDP